MTPLKVPMGFENLTSDKFQVLKKIDLILFLFLIADRIKNDGLLQLQRFISTSNEIEG